MSNTADVSEKMSELEIKETPQQEPAQQQQQKPEGKQDEKKQKQQKQKKEKKQKGKGAEKIVDLHPEYLDHRIKVFDMIQKRQQENQPESVPIKITLPDGAVKEGESWVTSPLVIAKGISRGLADNACIAKVDGEEWDMSRPLEKDCKLELLNFDTKEGKHVFWHSSAHILGQVMELKYGGQLCIGPALENGFYYDMHMEEMKVKEDDFKHIETRASQIVKEKQPFQRLEITKEEALEMFKYSKFKVPLIREKIPDGETCTVYRCGPLIDLCRGPHLPHTGMVKAFMVTKNSAAFWLGKADNDTLQRVYAVAFPDKKRLTAHKQMLAEAAKRDHRVLGKQQELFFFHTLSPGSAFFLPHGARIYNKLQDFVRAAYRDRGFEEVLSPNIFDHQLWKTSGHWQNYKDNMFAFECEGKQFGLKPMNCPGHCLMFGHRTRSYRELPLRMADFGVLHRNELSGALSGLTRVRRFQQDDAHIFCAVDQIESEMAGCLDFINYVYGTFGFKFQLVLSTRPEKYMGDLDSWNKAEASLEKSLNECGQAWTLNPADGAFYGPKIDIIISDAIGREHQCATIQLDFQLPKNFDLWYNPQHPTQEEDKGKEEAQEGEGPSDSHAGKPRPVIIHRAILGSVERFMAILIEHTAGKWPFWISPRQAMVVPISDKNFDYANEVQRVLSDAGYYVDVDVSGNKMQKKVRDAQIAQYNYILVVGVEETEKRTVNVRTRDNVVHGERTLDALLEEWKVLDKEHK